MDPSGARMTPRIDLSRTDANAVRKAIARLDGRHQAVLNARLFEAGSLAEVAQRLELSEAHVARLERQACRLLCCLLDDSKK